MSALVGHVSRTETLELNSIGKALDVMVDKLGSKPYNNPYGMDNYNLARDAGGSRVGLVFRNIEGTEFVGNNRTLLRKESDWIVAHGYIGPEEGDVMPSQWLRRLGVNEVKTTEAFAAVSLMWGNKPFTAPIEKQQDVIGLTVGQISQMICDTPRVNNWINEHRRFNPELGDGQGFVHYVESEAQKEPLEDVLGRFSIGEYSVNSTFYDLNQRKVHLLRSLEKSPSRGYPFLFAEKDLHTIRFGSLAEVNPILGGKRNFSVLQEDDFPCGYTLTLSL